MAGPTPLDGVGRPATRPGDPASSPSPAPAPARPDDAERLASLLRPAPRDGEPAGEAPGRQHHPDTPQRAALPNAQGEPDARMMAAGPIVTVPIAAGTMAQAVGAQAAGATAGAAGQALPVSHRDGQADPRDAAEAPDGGPGGAGGDAQGATARLGSVARRGTRGDGEGGDEGGDTQSGCTKPGDTKSDDSPLDDASAASRLPETHGFHGDAILAGLGVMPSAAPDAPAAPGAMSRAANLASLVDQVAGRVLVGQRTDGETEIRVTLGSNPASAASRPGQAGSGPGPLDGTEVRIALHAGVLEVLIEPHTAVAGDMLRTEAASLSQTLSERLGQPVVVELSQPPGSGGQPGDDRGRSRGYDDILRYAAGEGR